MCCCVNFCVVCAVLTSLLMFGLDDINLFTEKNSLRRGYLKCCILLIENHCQRHVYDRRDLLVAVRRYEILLALALLLG